MQKKIIIANWKMNPSSREDAIRLARKIERGIRKMKNTEVIIAPPFPFLPSVRQELHISKLGAQNAFWENNGAYTGEISPLQLRKFGVAYVIVGHSERRTNLHETDEMINRKIKAALEAGLIPILAVGEQKQAADKKTRAILEKQLTKDLAGISVLAFQKSIIAYEPVWAIGAEVAATAEHAKTAAMMIREILGYFWNTKKISTPIIYGGSVNAKNAASFVSKNEGGMDGMLVGGASLNAKEFIGIVNAAANAK